MVRELREELELDVDAADLEELGVHRQDWASHFDHVYVLHTEQTDVRVASWELRRAGWYPVHQLPQPLTREAIIAIDLLMQRQEPTCK